MILLFNARDDHPPPCDERYAGFVERRYQPLARALGHEPGEQRRILLAGVVARPPWIQAEHASMWRRGEDILARAALALVAKLNDIDQHVPTGTERYCRPSPTRCPLSW